MNSNNDNIRDNCVQKLNKLLNNESLSRNIEKSIFNFVIDNENLIIADNIAKYYSINVNSGKLNWSKNNTYPFNS